MSFGCERSCSSHRRVSNFNSKVPQGGIYPHTKFERDPLNTFGLRVLTLSGSTGGGGAAKTIISPNTSFGDIIRSSYYLLQFDLIYPYLAPKYHFCSYLALLIYICLYLAVFRLNYPYLGIFALNCPDFTICAIFKICICKILEQSDHYSWRYCILKIWGIQVLSANAV